MTSAAHTDDADWGAYYRRTAGRRPRPLLLDAMAHVPAEDLWSVSAVDLDSGLTAAVEDLEAVEPPRADLLLACMSLPFLGPTELATLWERILAALHPGGVLAVNLLGDRDSWAHGDTAVAGMTFHRRNEVEAMVSGLGILQLEEHEFDGPSGRDPKHWHRYDVIACR
ncbi:hypothetical protein [Nesterenkonia sp. HG001]|uniref:hypothetical protein n=1 Tax=Nesterenkonia sp. HG001 TaxID=2983207 RepID=UPI002AC5A157|nr:hypothetical protein [Nesterenkonia sp. HG001]MDZ5078318.1 hypothetical protein [Nesterenkonia sp. HG001]